MIYCHDCGDAFHVFCLNGHVVEGDLYSTTAWRCPNCKYCEVCLEFKNNEDMVMCDKVVCGCLLMIV